MLCCSLIPDQGVDLLCLDVIQAAHSLLDLLLVGSDIHNEDLHVAAYISQQLAVMKKLTQASDQPVTSLACSDSLAMP